MSSLNGLQARQIAAKGRVGQMSDNLGVALRIHPLGATIAPSVTVATATKVTLTSTVAGVITAVDYTWATYTTLGALAAKINGTGLWECKVLDALSTTATGAALIVDGAVTVSSNGYYDLLNSNAGATACKFLAYKISPDRGFKMGYKNILEHRVHIQEIDTNVTLGATTTNGFKIYEVKPSWLGGTETLIYQKTGTSGQVSTTTFASGNGKITADDGNDLLVIIADGTSITGSLTVAGIFE